MLSRPCRTDRTKFQTNWIWQVIWNEWDATCCLCLQFRKAEGGDFIFFSSYTGKISFYHKSHVHSYSTDPDYDCKITHTHTDTHMYMHILLRQNRKKNSSFTRKKTTLTCNSEIKCYSFCKMFHNSFYWFQWLSIIHTAAAAIVPHLMLMNACCLEATCVFPFIFITVDLFTAKKFMLSILTLSNSFL